MTARRRAEKPAADQGPDAVPSKPSGSGSPARRARTRDGRYWVKIGNTKEEMFWCAGGCEYGNQLRASWLAHCPRCGLPMCCLKCREVGHGDTCRAA